MYPWGTQSSYCLKAPGREGSIVFIESVSSPRAKHKGLQLPWGPPLSLGRHWTLCTHSNKVLTVSWEAVVTVDIHDCGMVHLYSSQHDPWRIPLVPGIPSNMKFLGDLNKVT